MAAHLKNVTRACVLLSLWALALGMAGCKTDEAKSAGFVDKLDMSKDPSIPFQRSWKKPDFDLSKFTKLYVAPVNTDYMLKMTEWDKGVRKEDFEKDVAELAVYTRDEVKKAFREDPKHRMQVLDAPTTDPDALVVELAIIEVVPSKVVLNALGFVPFGVGMTLNAVRFIAKDTSTCAFEGRIRVASTREIVAKLADREAQQMAIVSVRGLTWYSSAKTIITQWSGQFVEIANRKPGETVKDTEVFTLKPW
jgi:hypothetical protein